MATIGHPIKSVDKSGHPEVYAAFVIIIIIIIIIMNGDNDDDDSGEKWNIFKCHCINGLVVISVHGQVEVKVLLKGVGVHEPPSLPFVNHFFFSK